ncbi:hypothetical protein CXG81DRAFT_29693 [Caulochytrium protostelioides]|uniref:P-loop containing nucleoside triphosphate hydrolase protein n=1 Tax=Caulochytrium protostelioides TaxID=1555241 RepID=A0A4P9X9C5_9FUNG|nr:hypothetical protein CXG81DRAFT_29693 [Caulochytrium protostelioides]|eukprot:RKP01680.1 hypothetical protein CXG81DRAFT_29693 [Caulochytrium protostelioides]
MYTLLSGLYKQWTTKERYNVLVIGLDNAGKTTLLEKIKQIYNHVPGLPPEKIGPTVGLNIGRIVWQGAQLCFWDLGGQTALQQLWDKYYAECHGIIFVVDSCDSDRIKEVHDVLAQVVTTHDTEGVPILMLANKQDAPRALRLHDIKEVFNPLAVELDARDSKVLGISALCGEGVSESVDWMGTRLFLNKRHRPPATSQ